ncbi:MAG: 1D-myo-inositol 2-acetamido-2-deoxy-alpha-D-glucopyranoside deacetylase [bacterium ADurb.Bin429]|nr:MAG: 1D-myo-inositol 2-acetamido-2-deoxy-alpha-D-glucopyranoside deacetylase [bacterium ADurb.Bin429]
MTDTPRILAICAHDDDEVIGPGGTLRKLADAGADITTLVFCTGNEGFIRLEEKDSIVERRRGERAAAQRILGTRACIAFDYHDFDNLDTEAVYRDIMRTVRRIRPHLVFTHLSCDYLAHRTLGRLAPEAVWQAGWVCSLDLGEPWAVSRLYQFSIIEPIAKPSHIVDISDTFRAKLDAMRAYASQHEVVAGILGQIEGRAKLYGAMIGVEYGEAFLRSATIPVKVAEPLTLLEGV